MLGTLAGALSTEDEVAHDMSKMLKGVVLGAPALSKCMSGGKCHLH